MTFQEAVAYLTRNGDTLLEALELIDANIQEARQTDTDPTDYESPKALAAYRIVCTKMRPLFFP